MSVLIDKFKNNNVETEINSKWYIAKPLNKKSFAHRLKDCFRILRNTSIAVHYKEDERIKQ